jgi:hypothetical protein
MKTNPREIVQQWVARFNAADADGLAALYAASATNHQVTQEPVAGRESIREMFVREFSTAKMHCIIEQIFEDGEWAILEWRDPLGLRGCGLFHIKDGLIAFQRGYWDKLSFLRMHKLPIPSA